MATLTGNSVGSSYLGLLKTSDNAAIDGNLKNMTDGAGNATPLSMSNTYVQLQAPTIELIESTGGTNLIMIDSTQTLFEGAVDFTNATVTGIGAPGLVAGTGTDSMKSDDALTTVASVAAGARSIAIGDGANANSDGSIAIGSVANVPPAPRLDYISIGQDVFIAQNSIAIGKNTNAQSDRGLAMVEGATVASDGGIVIGYNARATGYQQSQTVIGNGAESDSQGNVAIGLGAQALGGGGFERTNICIGNGLASNERTIAIGHQTSSTGSRSIAIGENANTSQGRAITIGQNSSAGGFSATCVGSYSRANGERSVAVGGYNTQADGQFSVCLGPEATSTLVSGNAIGYQVTALWEAATTVNRLAMKDVANLNYADQAAAVAAGVPVGGVYHTDGALKIVY